MGIGDEDSPLKITLAIPCHNEEARLNETAFLALGAVPGVTLLLVNDGSTDRTLAHLQALARKASTCRVLNMAINRGKAEAVRRGLLQALDEGADIVGYADADLAVPIREIIRLLGQMRESKLNVLMGARVALLGRRIDRRMSRHYLGRVFATAASIVLGLPVYDTQCGLKFFRSTPEVKAALADPFVSRWAFDVELLGRLVIAGVPAKSIREEPLEAWREIPGSKLSLGQMVRAGRDLLAIRRSLRARSLIFVPRGEN